MDDLTEAPPAPRFDGMLIGGPADLPPEARAAAIVADATRVKVPHLGGYEHFERADDQPDDDERQVPEFHWTMRTRIAE
ncbi:DUF5988 family protein [Micromonospora sp. NPDC049044]|uniref:DUF5988 family protein n=1 Tax=unclassified Micromonospora TaxID=2617518 RepID=UPI0033D3F6AF